VLKTSPVGLRPWAQLIQFVGPGGILLCRWEFPRRDPGYSGNPCRTAVAEAAVFHQIMPILSYCPTPGHA
jgi:hypothetical protein